jgi:amino acid transporter
LRLAKTDIMASYPDEKPDGPKEAVVDNYPHDGHVDEEVGVVNKADPLKKDLRSRHMQMIAIGGAIGAGLFVGSGGALHSGGPASLVRRPSTLDFSSR